MATYNPDEFKLTNEVREKCITHLVKTSPVLTALYGIESVGGCIGNLSDGKILEASENTLGLFRVITPVQIIGKLGLPAKSSGNYRTLVQKHPLLLKPYEGFDLFSLNPADIDKLAGGTSLEEVLGDNMPTSMRMDLLLNTQNSCDPPKIRSIGGRVSTKTSTSIPKGKIDYSSRNSRKFHG